MKIKFFETKLAGVCILQSDVFQDERGAIWTTFDKEVDAQLRSLGYNFMHDKFNSNDKHVLRGIHYDNQTAKLVTCVGGAITQFVVNVDQNNKNFGDYIKVEMAAGNGVSVLIPPGFGNAFISRKKNSIYHYKLSYSDEYVDHLDQSTLSWKDERLQIDWDIDEPILSSRDNNSLINKV